MPGFVELIPLAVGGIELVAVVGALAASLVVIAGVILYTPLYGIFDSLKRRGGILGSIVNLMPFGWVFNPASKWINDQLTKYLTQMGGELTKGMTALGHAAWSVVGVCWRFIYVATEMFGYLTDQISGTNQRSQAGLAALRAQLAAKEAADIQTVDKYIEALLTKEEADVAKLTTSLNTWTRTFQTELSAEETAITGLQNTLKADNIPALRLQVNNLTQTLQSDVLNLNNTIRDDMRTVNATINRDVTDLKAADATNLRTAENFATSLVSGLGLGAITAKLTALSGQVSKIQTETTECLDPLCDTVTPQARRLGNLGKYLSGFELLALDALLVALAAECLTDPAAVVEDISSVVAAVGDPIVAGLRDVIGG